MCFRHVMAWKCGCIFDKWTACDRAEAEEMIPGPECTESHNFDRNWKRPVLQGRNHDAFGNHFKVKGWVYVSSACCSPHCCCADIERHARDVDEAVDLRKSGKERESVRNKYARVTRHHMNDCMPFFAKGLWKTNLMRWHMGDTPKEDIIPFVRMDCISPSGSAAIVEEFSDGKLAAYLEYKTRIKEGKGVRSQRDELSWQTLRDKLEAYLAELKHYNAAMKANQLTNIPLLRSVSEDELARQGTQAMIGAMQASAGSPVPLGSVAPLSSVTRSRQSTPKSPSPRQTSRQNSLSASPKPSSSKATKARTDPGGQPSAPFADELAMESLQGIADSPLPSTSSKQGSPVIRAQRDRPRQPSPLRHDVSAPSGGGSMHLAVPLRLSPSPDSELKWIEVCNRKDRDRNLGETLLPATLQSWDPFNEGVDEFQQGIATYLHALDESRPIEDFSTRQRKQLAVTDIARFRWVVKNFVQIQHGILGLNLAPNFEEPMTKQIRNLRDRLKGLEAIHTQWMQALSVAEQQELKEQIAAA